MLIGRDPLDNEVIWEELYNRLRDHGQKGIVIEALSGVDIALWDIKGKAAGLPVYKMMGGAFRTRVQPYATGFYRRVGLVGQEDALVSEAATHARSGFRAMKFKLGFGFEEDQRCVRAVRRALGNEMRWMADANHAYDASTALRLGRVLEENGYEWFEEPVTGSDSESGIRPKGCQRMRLQAHSGQVGLATCVAILFSPERIRKPKPASRMS